MCNPIRRVTFCWKVSRAPLLFEQRVGLDTFLWAIRCSRPFAFLSPSPPPFNYTRAPPSTVRTNSPSASHCSKETRTQVGTTSAISLSLLLTLCFASSARPPSCVTSSAASCEWRGSHCRSARTSMFCSNSLPTCRTVGVHPLVRSHFLVMTLLVLFRRRKTRHRCRRGSSQCSSPTRLCEASGA